MCGIAGFWGDFNPSLLDKMIATIAHRGPDGFGTYYSSEYGVGLGHRRLSIIDLSDRASQPMWDATKSVVTIFNGEIYNYRELRRTLEADGFSFNSESDTEVLLNLYVQKGVDMLYDLNGIFAFAIWDTRSKSLFMAKDHLGVKPLYYANTSKGLLFGSELKSLIQSNELDRTIRPESFFYYLLYLWSPAPYTPFIQVDKLEPGHALLYSSNKDFRKWRYYDLPYDKPILNIKAQDAAAELASKIDIAVKRQTVSDVEIGAFLSGGLDSSSVVAFAKKYTPDIKCFTMKYREDWMSKEGFSEDYPYAKLASEYLNVNLHVIETGPEMAHDISDMVYHLDEPHGDLTPLNAWLISKLARDNGIKVLLSGAGGDDILTGYRRHYAASFEKYFDLIPRSIRNIINSSASKLPQDIPLFRRFNKLASIINLPPEERVASHFHWITPDNLARLFSNRFIGKHTAEVTSLPLYKSINDIPSVNDALSRIMYLDGRHFLPDHNLAFTDKMGMATGVEVRVPLLDLDLVDFAVRLPMNIKQKGRIGKWIFKKSMEPYLPREVIYRSKTGFGPPLRHWLSHELSELVGDTLNEQTIKRRGLLDYKEISQLISNNKAGKTDASFIVLGLLCIELWFQHFIDRPPLNHTNC